MQDLGVVRANRSVGTSGIPQMATVSDILVWSEIPDVNCLDRSFMRQKRIRTRNDYDSSRAVASRRLFQVTVLSYNVAFLQPWLLGPYSVS
ncbi:hypothetical protein L596_023662 [Steinernema carpocapsae]|uniref:Uncharacterized protein n=1 Tax=Steinernema carpocapsae TaxID=34508 RepID=A0A4U5MEA6_STECR|nr:hypothetical protein L596_023662 [Steinernema carpocapsae]